MWRERTLIFILMSAPQSQNWLISVDHLSFNSMHTCPSCIIAGSTHNFCGFSSLVGLGYKFLDPISDPFMTLSRFIPNPFLGYWIYDNPCPYIAKSPLGLPASPYCDTDRIKEKAVFFFKLWGKNIFYT